MEFSKKNKYRTLSYLVLFFMGSHLDGQQKMAAMAGNLGLRGHPLRSVSDATENSGAPALWLQSPTSPAHFFSCHTSLCPVFLLPQILSIAASVIHLINSQIQTLNLKLEEPRCPPPRNSFKDFP